MPKSKLQSALGRVGVGSDIGYSGVVKGSFPPGTNANSAQRAMPARNGIARGVVTPRVERRPARRSFAWRHQAQADRQRFAEELTLLIALALQHLLDATHPVLRDLQG